MASPPKRAAPPTHPTVWIGLALSAAGLILALYAYSGIRVYDITYAVLAIVGGLVCLAGILLSAWGRAIMAARAGRVRRTTMQADAMKLATAGLARAEPSPHRAALDDALERTPSLVAEPTSAPKKRAFAFGSRKAKADPPAEKQPAGASVFAFKRRQAPAEQEPAPSATAESEPVPGGAARERLTVRCPRCSTEFNVEGTRPFGITCPSCSLSGIV